MSLSVANVPPLTVWVNRKFATGEEGPPLEGELVGAKSRPGHCLTFGVLLRSGAMYMPVPIHMMSHRPDGRLHELSTAQLWECFGYHFVVHEYTRLAGLHATAFLPHGRVLGGEYLWTFDWCNPDPNLLNVGYAEHPVESKCAHFLALEDGSFAALPNNRIRWRDANHTTGDWAEAKKLRTNGGTWRLPNNRLPAEDTDRFLYRVGEEADTLAQSLQEEPKPWPIPADAGPDGWRPIETAPKDGTLVSLMHQSAWPHPKVGRWLCEVIRPGWAVGKMGDIVSPTHWMPLPPQPMTEAVEPTPPAEEGWSGIAGIP